MFAWILGIAAEGEEEVLTYKGITDALCVAEHDQWIDFVAWAHLITLGDHKRWCSLLYCIFLEWGFQAYIGHSQRVLQLHHRIPHTGSRPAIGIRSIAGFGR